MAEDENSDKSEFGGNAVNKATVRIFRVLFAFVGQSGPCGVTELSRLLGMTKSMVHRALVTLEEQGYVSRDETTSLYQLGHRLIELSSPSDGEPTVHDLVAPFLRELVETAGETVVIAVPAGRRTVIVGGLESKQAISSRVHVGFISPLHVGPGGRCILANLPPDDISRYLMQPLERYTELTISDPLSLHLELENVRRTGYSLSIDELTVGTSSIGFPVLDADARPHGAIALSGPSDRFNIQRINALIPVLKRILDEMNRSSRLYRTTAVFKGE